MTQTHERGWGAVAAALTFTGIVGVALLVLAVHRALASVTGEMSRDGVAWFIMLMLLSMCGAAIGAVGIVALAAMLFGAWRLPRLRAARGQLADLGDAEPRVAPPALPDPQYVTVSRSPNQIQMVLREQIERDAMTIMRRMYPNRPPRQDAIMALFPHIKSHGYVTSVLDYLAEQGVCTAGSAGAPREWIANQP